MNTSRDGQAASNGQQRTAYGLCGLLEIYMNKPKRPASWQVHRGGVAPPQA